jgi:ABC-type transporter Mla subunit MlaD
MSNTVEQLKADFEAFLSEDAKFVAGNGAAGTRARKALQEVAKGVKARRNEITEEKNARKESKAA